MLRELLKVFDDIRGIAMLEAAIVLLVVSVVVLLSVSVAGRVTSANQINTIVSEESRYLTVPHRRLKSDGTLEISANEIDATVKSAALKVKDRMMRELGVGESSVLIEVCMAEGIQGVSKGESWCASEGALTKNSMPIRKFASADLSSEWFVLIRGSVEIEDPLAVVSNISAKAKTVIYRESFRSVGRSSAL